MAHNIGNVSRIDALNKDNYDTWCIQIEALLRKNDNWKYVTAKIPRPNITAGDQASIDAADAWDEADQKAKADLILCTSPSELKHIKGCETSRDVWEKFRSVYASQGPAKKALLLRRLTTHHMASSDDIREHINKFIE